MQYRSGKELRELFLSFFEEKGHKRFKSFSLIPDDPTLLFTIAGMVPFKQYFLGIKTPEVTRAVTSQKCVRTNDIENVGYTARHHTFFEMLGNFSFGDYFKNEIIPWSWEFLTERVGLDPSRLYATIYLDDDEAHDIWRDKVGLTEDHIVRLGAEDNFWAAGAVGPCGPCSEILYDQGAEYSCGKSTCRVGCDCDRYLEIWNLVFMEYNRDETGKLTALPKKNIDTGMGLERLAAVVQKTQTDFETDLFKIIIDKACELSGVEYGTDAKKDLAVRVISDHIRASAFIIADGVLPSNEGTGYVLRRLIRRSVRYGRLLGIDKPFLIDLLPAVRESIGEEYTELVERSSAIEQILSVEEERFLKTLVQGNELLEAEIFKLEKEGTKVLPGKVAFALYDTFGFPIELTEEMCDESSIKVDKEGFKAAMEEQRNRARASSKQTSSSIEKNIYTELANKHNITPFLGYTEVTCDATILAIIADEKLKETLTIGESAEIVLSQTPFYAEKGGQVGDKGLITAEGFEFEVHDTLYPVQDLVVHRGVVKLGSIKSNDKVSVSIDTERRNNIQKHHTATHLLHEALCRVLGNNVRQAGSLVTPTFLRFDFNYFAPLTVDEIRKVEEIVYEQVLRARPVKSAVMSVEAAKKTGAKSLFDEKYGEEVRILDIKGFSTEFCGGTHVNNTGEIGLIKIIRDEGIGSGIRRINAVVGQPALAVFQHYSHILSTVLNMLEEDTDTILSKVEDILDEKKVLERKNKELQVKAAMAEIENSIKPAITENGVDLILEKFDGITPDLLRQIGDKIRNKFPVAIIVLIGIGNERNVWMTSIASDEAVAKGAHAGKLLRELAATMGGKAGGKPSHAQGGAKDASKLNEALTKAPSIFVELMKEKN